MAGMEAIADVVAAGIERMQLAERSVVTKAAKVPVAAAAMAAAAEGSLAAVETVMVLEAGLVTLMVSMATVEAEGHWAVARPAGAWVIAMPVDVDLAQARAVVELAGGVMVAALA